MSRYTKEQGRTGYVVSMIALAVAAVVLAVWAVAHFSGRFQEEQAQAGPQATQEATAEAIPEDWPVQPSALPTDRLVRGDGKFPDPLAVDLTDPDEVAETAARLAVSWDAGTEGTEAMGMRWAGPLLDPAMVQPETPDKPGVPNWARASQEQAFTSTQATPVGMHVEHEHAPGEEHVEGDELVPSDTTGELVKPYQFRVVYGWQGRKAGPDGGHWVHPAAGARTVYLGLVERDGEWKVLDYHQEHLPQL